MLPAHDRGTAGCEEMPQAGTPVARVGYGCLPNTPHVSPRRKWSDYFADSMELAKRLGKSRPNNDVLDETDLWPLPPAEQPATDKTP